MAPRPDDDGRDRRADDDDARRRGGDRHRFPRQVGATAVAFEGDLGSLDALRQRRSPYPVHVHGEIDGTKAAFAAKVTVSDGAVRFDDLDLNYGPNAVKGELTAKTGGPRPKLEFKLAAGALSVANLPVPSVDARRNPPPRTRHERTCSPMTR